MSNEKAEIVRRACALYVKRSEAASEVFELYDPDIEINDLPGAPDQKSHKGYEGLVKFAVGARQVWRDIEVVPSEFIQGPDGSLVARLDGEFTGRGSGVQIQGEAYALFMFRDDKIFRQIHYATRAEAVDAAGLSE